MLESGWSNKAGNIFAYQKWLNFLIMSEMIDKYIFIKTQNDSVACTEGVLDYCWRFGLNFQLKESRALPGCKMTSSRNNITLVNTSPCPIHQKLIFPNRCWFILTKCFLRGGIISNDIPDNHVSNDACPPLNCTGICSKLVSYSQLKITQCFEIMPCDCNVSFYELLVSFCSSGKLQQIPPPLPR